MTRNGYPENPVLARVWRGGHVESQHRGAWCLVDAAGVALEGGGALTEPFFARSAIKCVQALPLLETGAAERYDLGPRELALAVSSHSAEPCHTETALDILRRAGLGEEHLRCGAQPPTDPAARQALAERGAEPRSIHNNCSGKHAGFLALARHLDADPARYLDSEDEPQRLVRAALAEVSGLADGDIQTAIDGCSAPTFRIPLTALATSFARVTNPDGLGAERARACRQLTDAVARHPVMLAGHHKRLCTDLVRVSGGALFPKIGAEAVYAIGVPGADRALAVKMDDGAGRGLSAVVVHLLARFGFLNDTQERALAGWRQATTFNWAGLEVGRIEVDA